MQCCHALELLAGTRGCLFMRQVGCRVCTLLTAGLHHNSISKARAW
jgi:hypothetical protein